MTLHRRHRWLFILVTLLAFVTSETLAVAHACTAMETGMGGRHALHNVQSSPQRTGAHSCHGHASAPTAADTLCAFHCHEGAVGQISAAVDGVPSCALLHDTVLKWHGKRAASTAAALAPARIDAFPRTRRSLSIRYCTFLI